IPNPNLVSLFGSPFTESSPVATLPLFCPATCLLLEVSLLIISLVEEILVSTNGGGWIDLAVLFTLLTLIVSSQTCVEATGWLKPHG
ncbi:hypothetical protein HAX54_012493, partial [Datura stramonium]|nr:hypothetical protein [Datura stramonium]